MGVISVPQHQAPTPANRPHPSSTSTMSSSSRPAAAAATSLEPVLELKYRRRAQGLPTTAVIPTVLDDPVVSQMKRLVEVFEHRFLPDVHELYSKALEDDDLAIDENGWHRGVRKITGGRYEIKVLGDYFTTSLSGFEPSLPQAMVEYAEAQAKRDERVQAMMRGGGQLTFADWSIIVSQQCKEQTIHTDVPVNNVQFGLILNDDRRITPGTRVVLREDFGPHTIDELVSTIWADAPLSLKECLLERPHVQLWINKILDIFGPMLQRIDVLEANMAGAEVLKECATTTTEEEPLPVELESTTPPKSPVLECGDLICTSGGVAHGGPACDHFRMVMFGAASPTPIGLYDVDDQFFAHSALLYVIQAVWDYVDTASKAFLLKRLAWVAQDYDPSIVDKHESTSALLTDFMNVVLEVAEDHSGSSLETATNNVVNDFLQKHGSKTQAELFEEFPPGLQAAMAASAEENESSEGVITGSSCEL